MGDDQPSTSSFEHDDEIGEGTPTGEFHQLTDEELKARDKRNKAVALAVVAFIAIVFTTTMLRLTQNLGAAS